MNIRIPGAPNSSALKVPESRVDADCCYGRFRKWPPDQQDHETHRESEVHSVSGVAPDLFDFAGAKVSRDNWRYLT
jgi:hypothetical protein